MTAAEFLRGRRWRVAHQAGAHWSLWMPIGRGRVHVAALGYRAVEALATDLGWAAEALREEGERG